MPLGAAAMAYVLWTRHLRHDPTNPAWPDRDRFVLSAGHGCALLYSLLHLTGYDALARRPQAVPAVGEPHARPSRARLHAGRRGDHRPARQGLGNAVGLAIAERWLAATFNRPAHEVVDHSHLRARQRRRHDGRRVERSGSLAGTLRLGQLIVLYDANRVTLSATTDLTFIEDVGGRFDAYGWHVQRIDGHDLAAVDAALTAARAIEDRPSLIVARTHIGYGSPTKQDTFEAHGEPLGADEVRATKRALGWPEEPPFHVPEDALRVFRSSRERGAELEAAWQRRAGRL